MVFASRAVNCFPRLRSSSSKQWLRTAAAALFALAMMWLLGWGSPAVTVEIRSWAGADGQIYYAAANQDYQPDQHVAFKINADGRWHRYRIDMPEGCDLERVRIDPGSISGRFEIRRIRFRVPGKSTDLLGLKLFEAVEVTNDLRREPSSDGSLRFVAQAPDPFIGVRLPPGAGVASLGNQVMAWLGNATAAALLWLLVAELALPLLVRRLSRKLRLPSMFHRLAARASDPNVLIPSPYSMAIVVFVICSAGLYVALNLNQSSLGVWEEIYPAKPVAQLVDFGTPRRVRSDEWNTQTPWVLNQVQSGEKDHNPSIGGSEAPLLAAVPVLHSWAIAQGEFIGFHLFNLSTGFSWWWAYKTFGLILSFFWLFLLLTRGSVVASVLGTVWVYGSSFTQWWFSSNMPELLIAFALATIGGIYLLLAHRRVTIGIGAALIVYSFLNLMLHPYPPFIVPMAYLGVAILAGLVLEPGRTAQLREKLRFRLFSLVAALLAIGLIGGNYLIDAMPSIEAMAGTSYPGHRIALGGGFRFAKLFYGFFEALRMGEQHVPLGPSNASEASSFVILMPLLFLTVPFAAYVRRKNALLVALSLYCTVVIFWISIPLPHTIESALQAMGWSWSPPARSVIGLGIGSIMVTTILFSRVRDDSVELRRIAVRKIAPALSFLLVLTFGGYLRSLDPVFFSPRIVLAASAIAAVLAAGVSHGRFELFAGGLAAIVIPALTVNPLVSGLSAIEGKPILLAAERQSNSGEDRWAVVGDFILSQGLKAKGLNVITGSQMIPNSNVVDVLDPRGEYKSIWNRYAHVIVESEPGRVHPLFQLRSPDLYVIRLDICGPDLPRLGVTRVAYTSVVPPADRQCLTPLDAPADSGVHLFRLSSRTIGAYQ